MLLAVRVTTTLSTPILSVAIKLKVGVIPILKVQPPGVLTYSEDPSAIIGLIESTYPAETEVVTVSAEDNLEIPELSVATR